MFQRIRTIVAVLAASALLCGSATAAAVDQGLSAREHETPLFLDMVLLRPAGLLLTTMGTALFVATSPIVLITRPTDIGKPFMALVARPFAYTFMDELGEH